MAAVTVSNVAELSVRYLLATVRAVRTVAPLRWTPLTLGDRMRLALSWQIASARLGAA